MTWGFSEKVVKSYKKHLRSNVANELRETTTEHKEKDYSNDQPNDKLLQLSEKIFQFNLLNIWLN